ncbi:MAG: type III pantothenate kinase [Gammaproteobacteria bacterium]
MILCLDVGNTHIFAGVFEGENLKFRFRYPSNQPCTSDTVGLFLTNVIEQNGLDCQSIDAICMASVVPSLDYSINAACIKYFGITPLELKPGVKTGVRLRVKNPLEVGADRIANVVAATHYFPNRPIILLDFGTATTVCAIDKNKAFLGGAILPGFKVMMESLSQNAAKLSAVDIVRPENALGKCTESNIQSGLYHAQLGAVKTLITAFQEDAFPGEHVVVLATGGYAQLLEHESLFEKNIPDLVLHGLRLVWEKSLADAPSVKSAEKID